MRTYRVARMDLVVATVTAFGSAVMVFFAVHGALHPEARLWLAVSALLLLALWMSWQYSPKRYDLTDEALIIVRGWPFPNISIPLDQIGTIGRVESPTWAFTAGVRRDSGTVLFSNSGRSWSTRLGLFYSAVTNFRCSVLIIAGETYIISPAAPDQFVQVIQTALSGLSNSPVTSG